MDISYKPSKILHVSSDPFNIEYLHREEIVFKFMLEEFEEKCEEFNLIKDVNTLYPDLVDILIKDIKEKFEVKYKRFEWVNQ